jgi:hypothetical protein
VLDALAQRQLDEAPAVADEVVLTEPGGPATTAPGAGALPIEPDDPR